jgi:hypothetical protein
MNLRNFANDRYQRHNRRRQEHLASLHLEVAGRSVLEVGAGVGDHTSYFLDRGCQVTSTDGRAGCVAEIRARYPQLQAMQFDANEKAPPELKPHQVVYAYGVLYHLCEPARALASMSELCTELLLLETCVSSGNDTRLTLTNENASNPTQAMSGTGCRPTRKWVWKHLTELFSHVYLTVTQPWHEEFPLDWMMIPCTRGLTRSIFVASRSPIDNTLLSPDLLDKQVRGS